jgi:uncharacterized protein YegL
MRGEPIEAVKTCLKELIGDLSKDEVASESILISIITYDRAAKVLLPLSKLGGLELPVFPPLESSPTNLGEALSLMCQRYDIEVKANDAESGYHLPLAVVMTDGSPSDTELFNKMCDELNSEKYPFLEIIGCAAGPKAKAEPLEKFATKVIATKTVHGPNFQRFWEWLSYTFTEYSHEFNNRADDFSSAPSDSTKIVL